jgi:hypothetical protein
MGARGMTIQEITRLEILFTLSLYIGLPGIVLGLFTAWFERKRPMATKVK